MDSISAIVLFTPVIAPAAVALGIDPLHLGVVFIVNMEIGYLAPPIATNLFVAASVFGKPFGQVSRAVLPSLAVLCVGLLVVTYVPTLTVGPVHALKGGAWLRPIAAPAAPLPAPGPAAPPPADKVLTIEEMMRTLRARQPAPVPVQPRATAGPTEQATPVPPRPQ
jgi:C4-dicarboxylate transporter, DctM subunit